MSHNLSIPRNDCEYGDLIKNNMINLRKIEENHILLFAKRMYEVSSCMHFVSLIVPSNHVQDLKGGGEEDGGLSTESPRKKIGLSEKKKCV